MNEPAAPLIEVVGLEAFYGRRRILHGVDFSVNRGEIRVIMGGSGSGKSTLLRHIIGLQRPVSGTVNILGVDVGRAAAQELLAVRRKLGVSFQGGALITSMSVGDNVALPLREHTRLDDAHIDQLAEWRLAQTGLAADLWDGVNRGTAFTALPQAAWLAKHCTEFGFILRYPNGKESITQVAYESWHMRYVGLTVAKDFAASPGLTLEEYLGQA